MEWGLYQIRSQTKAQTKTLNELTKVGKEQLDVGKELEPKRTLTLSADN